jgi:hypothetical protein
LAFCDKLSPMRRLLSLLALAIGCGGSGATSDGDRDAETDASSLDTTTSGEAGDSASTDDTATTADTAASETPAAETGGDLDGDGLDDAYEAKIASDYLPFLSFDPSDACPRAVTVYRVYPHPDAPKTRLHVIVDTLLEKDCGASGHAGDNEVFAMTIDASKPAPAGILAMRAISHQNTACEKVTNCGTCAGLTACTTASRKGAMFPVVFYSKDKHGSYLKEADCDNACFFTNFCVLAPTPTEPKLVNAGEPGKPLVNDLTKAGYITTANGWTEMTVFNYDVWGGKEFGKAGVVSEDLIDPAFKTPACP